MTSPLALGLLLLRLVVGLVFVAHGWNHIFGGGRIAGTGRWFDSLGMRPGVLHAWTASLTELGAGTLLALGLLTPLAGAGVVGVMLVAWITNHRRNGFFIFRPGEGYEYVMTLTFCGLLFGAAGGGAWSVDHSIGLFDPPNWATTLLCYAAGVGGACGLLAAFWRPNRPAPGGAPGGVGIEQDGGMARNGAAAADGVGTATGTSHSTR